MMHERKNGKTRSAASIYGFILTLLLDGKGISDCDATLLQFRKLTELHLSNNKLSALKNLPPTLQILHAYGNRIKDIDFGQCRALVHAGFGFNALAGAHLPMFKPLRSSLVSLDLSCNEFCQIDELTKALAKFPHLRHLYLMGNPMCMLRSYRRSFVAKLPKLLLLDGIEIKEEERLASSLLSSSSSSASSIVAEAPAAAADAAAAESGESALASSAAVAAAAAPSELVTMSVRLDSLFGVTIEEDAVTERSLYKVLAVLPDLKDKAADAQAAIAAAVAAVSSSSSADAVAPVAPMAKLRKTTSYHVVFRLADDAVHRSVDFDLAAVKAASDAAAAAAATAAPAAKGAKAAPAPAGAAAVGGSIEPVELPLNIEADVAFPPSVRWRNFLSLNLLDIFLIRRETTTPVVETEEEAAAAKAAAAPAAKKDAKAAPTAAAAPEVAEPAALPPACALLPGSTRELSAEQLSALTKVYHWQMWSSRVAPMRVNYLHKPFLFSYNTQKIRVVGAATFHCFFANKCGKHCFSTASYLRLWLITSAHTHTRSPTRWSASHTSTRPSFSMRAAPS
jgi:hypothetical protein